MQIDNQTQTINFKRNILVKGIDTTKGEIGHLAVSAANKAGIYKGDAISTIGTPVGTNDFLIIDLKITTGKLLNSIMDLKYFGYNNSHTDSKLQEQLVKESNNAIELVAKKAKTINYEG